MPPQGHEGVPGEGPGTGPAASESRGDIRSNGRNNEAKRIVAGLLENRPEAVATVTAWAGSVARHRAWGFDTAEDIVQDALLALLRNLKEGRFTGGDLRAYVRRITKNLCVTSYRRKRTRGTEVDLTEGIPASSSATERNEVECAVMVQEILKALDEPCRRIITLAFLDGLSRKEIAVRLAISEGAAKVRLFRCLEKARARREAILQTAEGRRRER